MIRILTHTVAALCTVFGAATLANAHSPARIATTVAPATVAQYGNDWRPGAGWDRRIDVRCDSQGFNYQMCQVDTGRGSDVRIVRQLSKTQCVEGRNWGWNRAGVWVDEGCSAVFRVERRWSDRDDGRYGDRGDWRPGPNWDAAIRVRCESRDFNYSMCQVDTGRGSDVRIERQISGTRCIEGQNWGWNRAGIWVDGGCTADFIVDRRWR